MFSLIHAHKLGSMACTSRQKRSRRDFSEVDIEAHLNPVDDEHDDCEVIDDLNR